MCLPPARLRSTCVPMPYRLFSGRNRIGRFQNGRQIERFVKLPLVDRAVAEEAKSDGIFLAVLAGEGETCRDGHLPADDGVAAHEMLLSVEQVHGAALAAAAAGRFAAQLCHCDFRVHPLGYGVAVVAVVSDDIIVGAERGYRADGDSLLADVEVQESRESCLACKGVRRLPRIV